MTLLLLLLFLIVLLLISWFILVLITEGHTIVYRKYYSNACFILSSHSHGDGSMLTVVSEMLEYHDQQKFLAFKH